MRDVPGIETLTMDMIAGQLRYTLNGREVLLPTSVSDSEVEKAVRNAAAFVRADNAVTASLNGLEAVAAAVSQPIQNNAQATAASHAIAIQPRGPTLSAIDRIKAKALQARDIAPNAIKDLESDLDTLIAEGPKLKAAKDAAVGQHKSIVSGVYGEIDGLKEAIDILSNGADAVGNSEQKSSI